MSLLKKLSFYALVGAIPFAVAQENLKIEKESVSLPGVAASNCTAHGKVLEKSSGQACCTGLTQILHPVDAWKKVKSPRQICSTCGDKRCDPNFENTFNCARDCSKKR